MAPDINNIHQGDCVELLQEMAPGSVDLVFADPPFNIDYDYDVYDDNRTVDDYVAWSRKWIDGVWRVLKPKGSFWLAIGDELAAELKVTVQDAGFTCRSWVIWYYTFGVNCRRAFSRSHTHLLYFVKDPSEFTFNADNPAVRIPSARQLVYADARANPKGRLPDNTWILRPQDVPAGFRPDHDTWYFPRVAGTFKEREGFHGCQMPEQLLARIIRISTNPSDVVLDPLAGSGTTLAVARKLGRQWIGIELSGDYARHIGRRLRNIQVGDPVDGAADPLRSAPNTQQGKSRSVLHDRSTSRAASSEKSKQVGDTIKSGVVDAYRATHDGFSTDYLIADPEMNIRFVEKCARLSVPGDPVVWNQTLLRLRKQGRLPKLAKSGVRKTYQDMDQYSFASEVALHYLSVSFDMTLDALLCDPDIAAKFDQVADEFAPGHRPFEYRWAALSLRKRAKQAKRMAANHQAWLSEKLPKPIAASKWKTQRSDYDCPGVYVLIGLDRRVLYVGESFQVGPRIEQIIATPTWQELDLRSVRAIPAVDGSLPGLKSVLIQRLKPELNSRLLFPQLESARV